MTAFADLVVAVIPARHLPSISLHLTPYLMCGRTKVVAYIVVAIVTQVVAIFIVAISRSTYDEKMAVRSDTFLLHRHLTPSYTMGYPKQHKI